MLTDAAPKVKPNDQENADRALRNLRRDLAPHEGGLLKGGSLTSDERDLITGVFVRRSSQMHTNQGRVGDVADAREGT
jgi:hypothetical protein